MRLKREKVIFIDRDGVINQDPAGWTEHSYVTTWRDFHFLPGVFAALKKFKKHRYKVIIISNQAGVGKGYFTNERLREITRKMAEEIRKQGGDVREAFYCTHTDEDNCACRKPKTGLFDKAMKKYKIDAATTYYIGDTRRDILAGKEAGLKTILVLTGKTAPKDVDGWDVRPDYICSGLSEAADFILGGAS
jgi:D-glycero-D-manno-heptose 1,7-bisphosphate phosphatase